MTETTCRDIPNSGFPSSLSSFDMHATSVSTFTDALIFLLLLLPHVDVVFRCVRLIRADLDVQKFSRHSSATTTSLIESWVSVTLFFCLFLSDLICC